MANKMLLLVLLALFMTGIQTLHGDGDDSNPEEGGGDDNNNQEGGGSFIGNNTQAPVSEYRALTA